MISYNKKFIFIHINKTAGTAVEQSLLEYGNKRVESKNDLEFELTYRQSQHFNYKKYKKYLGSEYDDFFKFTVVRNPFDRVVSYYLKNSINHHNLSFSDWVIDRYKNQNFQDYKRMYSDYTHWINIHDTDFILKFENLPSDFNILKQKLNLNCELEYHNVNKSRLHYKEYYDKNTKEIITNYFKKEINTFNYKF